MLTIQTSSKNENIQLLENGAQLAELVYPNISNLKATATYLENQMEFKLQLSLGSLLKMHKLDILKNGNQYGRIHFSYFKNAKIHLMDQALEKIYKVKSKGDYHCIVSDAEGNDLIEIFQDFKILKLKTEYGIKMKDGLKTKGDFWLELLLCTIFCANIFAFANTTAD